jgi:hypothetical protein
VGSSNSALAEAVVIIAAGCRLTSAVFYYIVVVLRAGSVGSSNSVRERRAPVCQTLVFKKNVILPTQKSK